MDWTCSEDFTGIDSDYLYLQLPEKTTDAKIRKYCSRLREQWAPLAKKWTRELNSEWFARCYLSLRLMAAATVMVASREFAGGVNLRIVRPYLAYYASLSCSRAFLLLLPEHQWNGGTLFELTHAKIIRLVGEKLGQLDRKWSVEMRKMLEHLRDARETFSYRFPLSTPVRGYDEPTNDYLIEMLRALCELVQVQTECMQAALEKQNAPEFPDYDTITAAIVCVNELSGVKIVDRDDAYRFTWFFRKVGRPANFNHIVSNGFVDDLFGNWGPDDELVAMSKDSESLFDPWGKRCLLFEFE